MFDGLNLARKFLALFEGLSDLFTSVTDRLVELRTQLWDAEGDFNPYLKQIRDAIGFDNTAVSVRQHLARLLLNDAVTDVTNLEVLRREIERIRGSEELDGLEDIGGLYNLIEGFRLQVIGPTSPTIAALLQEIAFQVQGSNDLLLSVNTNLTNVAEDINQLRINIGVAQNGLALAEQLQLAAECICELKELSFPTEPEVPFPNLSEHPCASAGTILMVIRPDDWFLLNGSTTYRAVPSYIDSSIADAFFTATLDTNMPGEDAEPFLQWETESPNWVAQMRVTTDSTTEVLAQLESLTYFLDAGPPTGIGGGGSSSEADNLSQTSGGCDLITVAYTSGGTIAVQFSAPGEDFSTPPSYNVIFYSIPE